MKSLYALLMLSALLVGTARAQADELDELLASEPAIGTAASESPATGTSATGSPAAGSFDFGQTHGVGNTDSTDIGYQNGGYQNDAYQNSIPWQTSVPLSVETSVTTHAVKSAQQPKAASAAQVSASAKQAKPPDARDFNVVPEPSAIVLGVLALLYFLVFGRRRHVA